MATDHQIERLQYFQRFGRRICPGCQQVVDDPNNFKAYQTPKDDRGLQHTVVEHLTCPE